MRPAWSAIAVLLFVSGCKDCLHIPESDTTPPRAKLTVEFTDLGGEHVSLTVTDDDQDLILNAPRDQKIHLFYHGHDSEGLETIELIYELPLAPNLGPGATPIPHANKTRSDCPKASMDGSFELDTKGQAGTYTFRARAQNWLGLPATSAKITVQVQ